MHNNMLFGQSNYKRTFGYGVVCSRTLVTICQKCSMGLTSKCRQDSSRSIRLNLWQCTSEHWLYLALGSPSGTCRLVRTAAPGPSIHVQTPKQVSTSWRCTCCCSRRKLPLQLDLLQCTCSSCIMSTHEHHPTATAAAGKPWFCAQTSITYAVDA